MRHEDYTNACDRTEHKDMPARLRNIRTGEIGTVVQCTDWDNPDVFLVMVGEEVTSWTPEDVEEVEGEA